MRSQTHHLKESSTSSGSESKNESTMAPSRRPGRLKSILRYIAALSFVAAGVNHFLKPDFYAQIVPPSFPAPVALVAISGAAEIAGGLGLLIPPLRRAAVWGLIALLIAVFPANIYMAVARDRIPNMHFPSWMLWLRLPMQAVFIAWLWYVRPTAPVGDSLRNQGR